MNRNKECFAIRMNDIIAIFSIDHFDSLSKFAYENQQFEFPYKTGNMGMHVIYSRKLKMTLVKACPQNLVKWLSTEFPTRTYSILRRTSDALHKFYMFRHIC